MMAITMKAKFRVVSVEDCGSGKKVTFGAVGKSGPYPDDGSDDDNSYAKWTPSAHLEMHILNPALFDKFEPGAKFHATFSPAAE